MTILATASHSLHNAATTLGFLNETILLMSTWILSPSRLKLPPKWQFKYAFPPLITTAFYAISETLWLAFYWRYMSPLYAFGGLIISSMVHCSATSCCSFLYWEWLEWELEKLDGMLPRVEAGKPGEKKPSNEASSPTPAAPGDVTERASRTQWQIAALFWIPTHTAAATNAAILTLLRTFVDGGFPVATGKPKADVILYLIAMVFNIFVRVADYDFAYSTRRTNFAGWLKPASALATFRAQVGCLAMLLVLKIGMKMGMGMEVSTLWRLVSSFSWCYKPGMTSPSSG